jgi:hypothetical protein
MRWILALAALGTLAGTLAAQSLPPVALGGLVRLRPMTPAGFFDREVEGTIERLSGDTITLRPRAGGQSQVFAAVSRGELYVFAGRRPALARGAVLGATFGLLAGAIVGALAGEVCTGNDALCVNRRQVSLATESALMAVGTATGLVIGAFNPRDTWKRTRISPQARLGISMGAGGVGLGVSLTR